MNDLENNVYQGLTHEYGKTILSWHEAMDRARNTLNAMTNAEFLKLISDEIASMLNYKEDAK